MKTRAEFLENMSAGNIVAFKNGEDMYSGKVEEITGGTATIKTKNGSVYYVDIANIAWVKNGSYWPDGIFNALKATKKKTERDS